MSVDLLVEKIKEKGNPSVAGLDPKIDYVPEYIRKKAYAQYGQNLKGATEAIWEFNKGLIDALYDVVPAVKPQSAFYEMYGLYGEEVLHTWFAGYFPAENPRYIIVVMNEHGKYSSTDCAPAFKTIADGIYDTELQYAKKQ